MSGEEFAKAPAIPEGLGDEVHVVDGPTHASDSRYGVIYISSYQSSDDLMLNDVRIFAEMVIPMSEVMLDPNAGRTRADALLLTLKRVQEEVNGG